VPTGDETLDNLLGVKLASSERISSEYVGAIPLAFRVQYKYVAKVETKTKI
jgi:hypothetical protein